MILPGGFSYGDYLRCGAIARFSPVMGAVAAFAGAGGGLGICNGFQVLCEAGLLPGALLRNAGLRFVCREVEVVVESTTTAWTAACTPGATLAIPVKHGEGRYVTTPPPWPPPARSCSATPPPTTPTAPWPTSPASATPPATSSASCPTPSTPSTRSSARWAAGCCSSRSWPPVSSVVEGLHRQLGLTDEELERILGVLGREPTRAELAMFSLMWSEHCSYKSSKVHLRRLPSQGRRVLQGPGENAGVVDLGGGVAAVFKIESHNHPSFVEPFQGAATGVGGIIRDILAMGARPAASLNSLRFGDPAEPMRRRLVEGVVAGIGHYGNCVGVATVGGRSCSTPATPATRWSTPSPSGSCRRSGASAARPSSRATWPC